MIVPADRTRIRRHLRKVAGREPAISRLLGQLGYPEPRKQAPGFEALVRIIVSQQVSTRGRGRYHEPVIETLTTIRGFGRWSAQIYAMFSLGHRDIYPGNDLALQVALQRHLGLTHRPSAREAEEITRRWSPYLSSVALLMWKY